MKAMRSARAGAGARVPRPPGTIRTSREGGGAAKVWVGTTLWLKFEVCGFIGAEIGLVETGSRVEAMSESVMGWRSESRLSASRGPKTSRAWKPGKGTMS